MADLRATLEYAEEKLSRLHPDERDNSNIGMMVESGFLKEIVELLTEQRAEIERLKKQLQELGGKDDCFPYDSGYCDRCSGKDTCESRKKYLEN